MARGSMTVFFAMILVTVASLLFSMTEVVRYAGLKTASENITRRALDNSGSEYNRYLWQRYRILALDESYGSDEAEIQMLENRILQFTAENGERADGYQTNFYRLSGISCEVTGYGCLTDEGGKPFIMQGAACAKRELGKSVVDDLVQEAENTESALWNAPDVGALVQSADSALKNAVVDTEEAGAEGSQQGANLPEIPPDWDNPLAVFRQISDKGLLGLALPDAGEVSGKVMDLSDTVSQRSNQTGTMTLENDIGIDDRILFARYLVQYFCCYGRKDNGAGDGDNGVSGGMDYEAEYVICGRGSDRENLSGVVERLLAVRAAENLLSLWGDSEKRQQALSLAIHIAGFTQNPGLIRLVQTAVAAVWALVESILDVRLLLGDGRVALVKSAEEWSSDLYHLGNCLAAGAVARDCGRGFTYRDYLTVFLCLSQGNSLGYRALDVMECALRSQPEYVNCRMDCMLYGWEAVCTYRGTGMFYSFIPLEVGQGAYDFAVECGLSYL